MIVDEMDLLGQLKQVAPLPDEAFERARMTLGAAMAVSGADSGPASVPGSGPARGRRGPRRRTVITRARIGIGIGIGAAAAAAVALVVTSTSPPAATAGGQPAASRSASASVSAPASASASASAKPSAGSPSAALVLNSRLLTVADVIKSHQGPLPGNASLVIRTQTNGASPEVNYELYTDSGDYYWGMTSAALAAAVASGDNRSGGLDAREVAAARYAANGDLTTARVQMINATPNPFGLGDTPAQKKALAKKLAAENAVLRREGIKVSGPDKGQALQEDYDNYIWNNSLDALTDGGGNPQVRIGVLRLLATVPWVTVENSTAGGQPTLTLTAGTALFDGTGDQVLTIDASTGIPISSESGVPGQAPTSTTTFRVSRVTLADVAAGKF
jgi:hypothetical protein